MKNRFFTVLCLLLAGSAQAADPLPKLNINPNEISLTGLSSGGYMAVQYHAVYGATVKGAGIIAAGPYHCAGDAPLPNNVLDCVNGTPDASLSISKLKANAASGLTDPVEKLADARVYLFLGTRDSFVTRPVVDALQTYYQAFLPDSHIKYVANMEAEHGFLTDNPAHSACATMGDAFINNCQYDQAGEILQWIYAGKLAPRNSGPLTGKTIAFDQLEAAGSSDLGLEASAYLYAPAACLAGEACRLHIVFHGCGQSAEAVADKVYGLNGTGHQRWADSNRMVVLYPQVAKSLYNPYGCWDWWGYSGAQWDTKQGRQLKGIRALVDRLTAAYKP